MPELLRPDLPGNASREELANAVRRNNFNNSADNSPLLPLEERLKLENYRYPSDLGVDGSQNRHMMRIFVYKQLNSVGSANTVSGNSYDFGALAGRSKVKKIGVTVGAFAGAVPALLGKLGSIGGVAAASTNIGQRIGQSAIGTPIRRAGVAAAGVTAVVGGLSSTQIDLRRKTQRNPSAYISLYMPNTLNFVDRQNFDAVSVTQATGLAGLLDDSDLGKGEISATTLAMTGVVGEKFVDVSLFDSGYALNPQLEVLYQGAKNREFIFQFKFLPRTKKEADEVESIIRTLRYHAAPEYTKDSAARYLVPPSEFEIEFFIGQERNTHLPRISQCALANVDVNYAPSGKYAAFTSGNPVEISLQLTFIETIVLTKEDIKVGY